jgi:hypothetical protein
MRHPMTAVIVAGICLSSPLAADAQDWHGIVGDIADRAAHKAADKALDKATQSAPPSGSNSSNESNGSNGANGADTQPGTSASQPGASGAAAGQGAAPGSFKSYQNYDFVPGDKIVFDDDFHTDTDGEFPAHWKLLKGQGVVNLMQGAPVFALTEGNYVEVEPRVRTASYLSDSFTVEWPLSVPTVLSSWRSTGTRTRTGTPRRTSRSRAPAPLPSARSSSIRASTDRG